MTTTKSKKSKSVKRSDVKVERKKNQSVISTIDFSVDKSRLVATRRDNSKRVVYTLTSVYAEIFDKATSKAESKKAFNVLFLATLELDAKSKKALKCKNTCYDRYYKLLDFLSNNVFDKKLKAKYRNKLANFNKRN